MEFLKTEKGRLKLCFEGYVYYKDREVGGKVQWGCKERKEFKCPARITTSDDKIVRKWKEHNHPGDQAAIVADKTLNMIRNCATSSKVPPIEIIKHVVKNCPEAVAPRLPSLETMKRTVRKIRQRANMANEGPPSYTNRCQIVFPPLYTETIKGDEFLLYDSGANEQRILIFATKKNLELLAESEEWYADGTFKSVPLLFGKLYTIHGFKKKTSIPLVSFMIQLGQSHQKTQGMG